MTDKRARVFKKTESAVVTILGAGIAGLTAAHELIERGFDVQVIERNPGDPSLDRPDVGGVARTQWCTVPEASTPGYPTRLVSMNNVDWAGSDPKAWSEGSSAFAVSFRGAELATEPGAFAAWVKGKGASGLQLVLVVYRDDEDGVSAAYARLNAFESKHEKLGGLPVDRLEVDGKSGDDFVGLLVRRHHDPDVVVAGEPGYRMFPGCYRHLRDTMRRTPIFDRNGQRFSTATVHDSLTPIRVQVVADPTRDSRAAFSRKPPSSLTALWKQYQDLRRDLGYRPADLLRFSLRLMRYMTSSTERRREYYEKISWFDFLTRRHLDRDDLATVPIAQRYRRLLGQALESVVAVKSNHADARTVGNFSVQLTTSGVGDADADAILRGPSSDVWFRHWREYLEKRGVRFFVGEVTKIDTTTGAVAIELPRGKNPDGFLTPEQVDGKHYFVCAMDAPSVRHVVSQAGRTGAAEDIFKLVPPRVESIKPKEPAVENDPAPLSRFQTLTGIQLFYSTRLSPDASHIYYADSAWSLSAISQVRQWDSPESAALRLSSMLSINIGSWRARKAGNEGDVPLPRPDQLASAEDPSTLDAQEIASEVQRQIAAGRVAGGPKPAYFHIDDSIQLAGAPAKPDWNRAPYLVNLVDDWQQRPKGEPWSPADSRLWPRLLGDARNRDPWEHKKGGYLVHRGNIVFAGTHMRTFTRLTSMEAANESARHAVNAILDHLSDEEVVRAKRDDDELRDDHPHEQRTPKYGAYCDIWDPEQHEHADLEFVRLIDKYLVEASAVSSSPLDADDAPKGREKKTATRPLHLFDLLGLDHLPDMIEDDASSERVFELLGLAIDALQKLSSKDTSSVFGVIDTFRKKFDELVRP